MNEPLFVPETIFVDDLLAAFRNTNNQMAILLDEYGGVAGLVTFEDLLEEIVRVKLMTKQIKLVWKFVK